MCSTDVVGQTRASGRKRARLALLVTIFCAVAFIGVAAEQISAARFSRFGSVGRSLTERELTQIADLANAAGKPAWLVLGFPSMIAGVTTLTVYLQPDATREGVGRGRILRLVADNAPGVSERSSFRVKDTATYAFIPLAGLPREIADERDPAGPFAVDGEIDDETLISLVSFVRSRPQIPGVPHGQAPREVPRAPLSAVWRQGDQFLVGLRLREDAEGFGITLIRKGGQWVVTKWNWSVA